MFQLKNMRWFMQKQDVKKPDAFLKKTDIFLVVVFFVLFGAFIVKTAMKAKLFSQPPVFTKAEEPKTSSSMVGLDSNNST